MKNNEIKNMQVEEITDKRTPLETVVPLETPFIIHIDPCGACNFKCSFCPCNNSDFMPEERHKMMSFDLFKKVVDDIKEFKQKIKSVNLYCSGEPLLNKSFVKMVKYLKESDVTLKVKVVTNGSLLTPELNNEILESGLDMLKVSIEGIKDEDYINLCKADINFNSILNNIKDLYNKKVKQNKKTMIHIKAVNSMLKTAEEKLAYFELFKSCSDSCVIENVKDIWGEFNVGSEAKKSDLWEYERPLGGGTICSLSLYTMVVHSNGVVSGCCTDWKFQTQYGDVTKDSLYNIWHSEKLRKFQIQLIENGRQSIPFCSTCGNPSVDNIDDVKEEILDKLKRLEE